MSPLEIERANNTVLKPPGLDLIGISNETDPYPRVTNMKRYISLAQNELDVWGHSASVKYGFFDDKLFTYGGFSAKTYLRVREKLNKK